MDTLQKSKAVISEDKMNNSIEISIKDEEHTLGNLLATELQNTEHVTFAAYKVPHPLQNILKVRIEVEGERSPLDSVKTALEKIKRNCESLQASISFYKK